MPLDKMFEYIFIPFIISYSFRILPLFVNLKMEASVNFTRFVEYFSYITIGNIIYASAFGEKNIFSNIDAVDVLKISFIFLSFGICSKIKNITYNFLICVTLFPVLLYFIQT